MTAQRQASIRKAIGIFILVGTAMLVAMKIGGVTDVSWWMVFVLVWVWMAIIVVAFAVVGIITVLALRKKGKL